MEEARIILSSCSSPDPSGLTLAEQKEKPASADDYIFYNSESDELPIGAKAADSVDAPQADSSNPPEARVRRAAAIKNPFAPAVRVGGARQASKTLGKRPAEPKVVDSSKRPRLSNAIPLPPAQSIAADAATSSDGGLGTSTQSDYPRPRSLSPSPPYTSPRTADIRTDPTTPSEPDLYQPETENNEDDDESAASPSPSPVPSRTKMRSKRRGKKGKRAIVLDSDNEVVDAGSEGDLQYTAEELETLQVLDYSKRYARARNIDTRTDDIRTCFTVIEKVEKSGSKVRFQRCDICWNKGNPIQKKILFSFDSSSTLRKHIRSCKGHFEIYERRCKEKDIPINPFTIPKDNGRSEAPKQQTLGFEPIPKHARVTKEGFIKAVTEMTVVHDHAMLLANHASFRKLVEYVSGGKLRAEDLPDRLTITGEIVRQAEDARIHLKAKFQRCSSRISFAFDAGTSKASDDYLGATAQWIDGTEKEPDRWELRSQKIAFRYIDGGHDGRNLGRLLFGVFRELEITHKAGWSTSDNASVNDKALKYFSRLLSQVEGIEWDPISRRFRCMEHSLNIAAFHVIDTLSPTKNTSRSAAARAKIATEEAIAEFRQGGGTGTNHDPECAAVNEGGRVRDNGLSNNSKDVLSEEDEDGIEGYESDPGDPEEDDPWTADSLTKLLHIIRLIRASPLRRRYFDKLCLECKVKPLHLKTYVKTRWSSMYDLLTCANRFREPLRKFCYLADYEKDVPKLKSPQCFLHYIMSEKEWDTLDKLTVVLRPIALACQSFSENSRSAVYRCIPVLEFIQEEWEARLTDNTFAGLHPAIEAGLVSLRKWYRLCDNTDAYTMALFLNPSYKFAYIEEKFDEVYKAAAKKTVERTFDEYAKRHSVCESGSPRKPTSSRNRLRPGLEDNAFGISWMEESIANGLHRKSHGPRDELERYMREPLITKCIPVQWWSCHQAEYPILSCMARDYLAIPASSTDCERLFSSAGLIGTDRRSRLHPDLFEDIQMLKSSYLVGDTSAEEQRIKSGS